MNYAIAKHSGARAPGDALELLWRHLEGRRFEEIYFRRAGRDILVSTGHDTPVAMERDEREEIGRQEVLDCLREICERAPELELDWYAVAPRC